MAKTKGVAALPTPTLSSPPRSWEPGPWMPLWLIGAALLLLRWAMAPATLLDDVQPYDAVVSIEKITLSSPDERAVSIVAPRGPWQSVRLDLHPERRVDADIRLSRDNERRTVFAVPIHRSFESRGADLPGDAFSPTPLRVEILLRDEALSEPLDLRGSMTFSIIGEADSGGRPLASILLGAFLPLALGVFLAFAGRRTIRQAVVLSVIGGVGINIVAIGAPQVALILPVVTCALFVGATTGAAFRAFGVVPPGENQVTVSGQTLAFLALGAVGAFALFLRLEQLHLLRSVAPPQAMPLFLTGLNGTETRFLALLFAVGAWCFAVLLFWRASGMVICVSVAAFVGWHPGLIDAAFVDLYALPVALFLLGILALQVWLPFSPYRLPATIASVVLIGFFAAMSSFEGQPARAIDEDFLAVLLRLLSLEAMPTLTAVLLASVGIIGLLLLMRESEQRTIPVALFAVAMTLVVAWSDRGSESTYLLALTVVIGWGILVGQGVLHAATRFGLAQRIRST